MTGFLKKAVTFPLVPISSSSISCLKSLISLDGVTGSVAKIK